MCNPPTVKEEMRSMDQTEKRKIESNKALVIRKAEISDYEEVRFLEKLDLDVHRQGRPDYFKVQTEGYSMKEYEELLALPCPVAWLAMQDGRVVGLCFGKIAQTPENHICKSRKVAYIEDLVTLPECRGQGVATALMARARKQALEEQAEAMELCVWDFNETAMRLYKNLGMRVQYYRMEERLKGV